MARLAAFVAEISEACQQRFETICYDMGYVYVVTLRSVLTTLQWRAWER